MNISACVDNKKSGPKIKHEWELIGFMFYTELYFIRIDDDVIFECAHCKKVKKVTYFFSEYSLRYYPSRDRIKSYGTLTLFPE
jgi:hypothetical protein